MKNEKSFWTMIMCIGILFIAGGLGLWSYNLFTEYLAGEESIKILNILSEKLPEAMKNARHNIHNHGENADNPNSYGNSPDNFNSFNSLNSRDSLDNLNGIDDLNSHNAAHGSYQGLCGKTESMDMPVLTIDGEDYVATIYIPKIQIELPVMNEWSYPRLRTAPCRFHGDLKSGKMLIVAHNYSTHFGKLKLLEKGDRVELLTMNGISHNYVVDSVTILNPDAVTDIYAKEWPLTLCTCTIGGKKRVVVHCRSCRSLHS